MSYIIRYTDLEDRGDKIEDGDFKRFLPTMGVEHVKHCAVLFVSVLFAPVLIRLALLSQKGVAFSSVDLHGFISDLLVSSVIALFLVFIFRIKPLAGILILLIWSLLNYGAYEHVMALGALPSLSNIEYMADTTFLRASVLSVSKPGLFVPVVIFPAVFSWLVFRGPKINLRLAAFLYPAIVLFVINIAWMDNSEALMWRQANFVDDNVDWLFTFGDKGRPTGSSGFVSLSGADMSGSPVIVLPGSAKNVLLIMLESVSGAHIESAADYHNIESPISMPLLSEVAKKNMHFRTFITNQRQTNRGEYSVLCGEYPKLASEVAKMSEVVFAGVKKPCLPALLSSAGFETVYLQSAPLAFMLKDQFMERIGFSRVYGKEYFLDAYKMSTWGVDDKAYFEQSVEMVAELSKGEKPWFLTMLTVGTHDPYNVPDAYTSLYEEGSIGEAFSYLDAALADFLATLKAKGLLKDTLVLLTSDESAGITHKTSDFITKLSQNWGFFVAIVPEGERMEIDDSFMQVDIPLSILDYMGLAGTAHDFSGRSLFRKYDKKRKIFFANTYMRTVGVLNFFGPFGFLSTCDESFRKCFTYKIDAARPFSLEFEKAEFTEGDRDILMAAVSRSKTVRDSLKGFELELISADRSVNISSRISQLIFGGQSMSVPMNTGIEVELDIEVLDGDGRLKLLHDISSRYFVGSEEREEIHFTELSPLLTVGDRFRLRYIFYSGKRLNMMECRLFAKLFKGEEISLKFNRAHLKAVPCIDKACLDPGLYIKDKRLNGVSLMKDQG